MRKSLETMQNCEFSRDIQRISRTVQSILQKYRNFRSIWSHFEKLIIGESYVCKINFIRKSIKKKPVSKLIKIDWETLDF